MSHTAPTVPEAGRESFALADTFPASLVWGLAIAAAAETVALHLWLAPRHPVAAWTLVALTVLSVAWLAAERRAAARRPIEVDGRTLVLRAGNRLHARLDLAADVASVERLTWRTLPAPAGDYLNAAKPGEPNVLVTLRRPTPVRIVLGITKTVTRVGLAVVEPERFVAVVGAPFRTPRTRSGRTEEGLKED